MIIRPEPLPRRLPDRMALDHVLGRAVPICIAVLATSPICFVTISDQRLFYCDDLVASDNAMLASVKTVHS
jgi:hypothetical protein